MATRQWVIMVYLAADDTLANFAIGSLKQLKDTATDEVVVFAQFDPDGLSGRHNVRRYMFDKSTQDKLLRENNDLWCGAEHRNVDMTNPQTLTDFMNCAYEKCGEANYCLILWGHGPELLFELPVRSDREIIPGGANSVTSDQNEQDASTKQPRTYFAPAQLRQAIQKSTIASQKKLKIIGIDACSMSMCEAAYELRNQAQFLVASQEEVPDLSFPYHDLVKLFSTGAQPRELCREAVVGYVTTYQEYFYNQSTGMHPVTLAAIELEKMDDLKAPLEKLATALAGVTDSNAAKDIYCARRNSQSYVGGVYVDLHEFCDKLAAKGPQWKDLCNEVSKAIDAAVVARAGAVDGHVSVALDGEKNSVGLHSHGLSIYFPYLDSGKEESIEQELVKGIPRLLDKNSQELVAYAQLNAISVRLRYEACQQMIRDIETYYQCPQFEFAGSKWYDFIQRGWSRILAHEEPDNVDKRYLAEQCVRNLLTAIGFPPINISKDKKKNRCSPPPAKPNGHSISPGDQP